jgi:hypothetical protein
MYPWILRNYSKISSIFVIYVNIITFDPLLYNFITVELNFKVYHSHIKWGFYEEKKEYLKILKISSLFCEALIFNEATIRKLLILNVSYKPKIIENQMV